MLFSELVNILKGTKEGKGRAWGSEAGLPKQKLTRKYIGPATL